MATVAPSVPSVPYPPPPPPHAVTVKARDPEAAALLLKDIEDTRSRELAAERKRHDRYQFVGRLVVAAVLLGAALEKVLHFGLYVQRLEGFGLHEGEVPLMLALTFELGGGLLLGLGMRTRRVAGVLLGYLAALTVFFFAFTSPELARWAALAHVGLAGGLWLLLAHGAGLPSIDDRSERELKD